MAKRPLLAGLILLAALELAVFGPWSGRMGFYQDDWSTAEFCLHAPDRSLPGMVRAFDGNMVRNGSAWYIRPGNILYYPFLVWLGGLEFWRYQAAIMVQEAAAAGFLFLALATVLGSPGLSLLTALVFLLLPNHGATHHWFSASATPAMALCCAAFWAYAVWLERGAAWRLALALLLFVLGALNYEAVVPLALFFPFLGHLRDQRLGAPASWGQAARRFAPFAAAVLLLIAYHSGVQRWGPRSLPRHMAFDPAFLLRVLGKGFECGTSAVLDVCRRSLVQGWGWLRPWHWAAAAALGGAAAWAWRRLSAAGSDRPVGWSWPAGALALLLAANLPYALSADKYLPHVFDVQNRLNLAPSVAAAMLWAWALWASGRRVRTVLVGAAAAVFLLADWHNARNWAESWRLQREILEGVRAQAFRLPAGPAVVILEGAPPEVGQVPVFDQSHAFDPALKVWLGRQDVRGTVMTPTGPERTFPADIPRFRYDFRAAEKAIMPMRRKEEP